MIVMPRRPKVTNVIHREVRPDGSKGPYRGWNGVGLPPEWRDWGMVAKVGFLISLAVLLTAGWFGAHWLADVIAPLRSQ